MSLQSLLLELELQTGAVTLISNANTAMKSAMTIESQTFGTVNTIAITSHGSGYESIPTVKFTEFLLRR